MCNCIAEHKGYEIGPIRPPSEGKSLLLRITRNCSWNKCTFCTTYKGKKFSIRPIDHIKEDIDKISMCVETFKQIEELELNEIQDIQYELKEALGDEDLWAYQAARSWYYQGMKSIFLQDADSMAIKPDHMVEILNYIREKFGNIERITSYARSDTIARISDEDLKKIADAGLTKLHIGMESASDTVLELVNKGIDKATHIKAGQKVKKAGIELALHFIPGLGGTEYSTIHVEESADAINQINPEFIRIIMLGVTPMSQLLRDYKAGVSTRANDTVMISEVRKLIEKLDVTSYLKSEHILNLIPEVHGKLPEDKEKMLKVIDWYLSMDDDDKIIYRIGRRTGIINKITDIEDESKLNKIKSFILENNIDEENVDIIIDELMSEFI